MEDLTFRSGQGKDHLSATEEMCKYCFDVLIKELHQQRNITTNSIQDLDSIPVGARCPLFVTWDKRKETEYTLRGCIGTLAPRELRTALSEYARISAFKDPRFRPVSLHEVPCLRVSVSLLVNYEDCENCLDWVVGVHGIIINFDYRSQSYSGKLP